MSRFVWSRWKVTTATRFGEFREPQLSYVLSLRQLYCSVPSRHCTLLVVICFPLASWVLTERSVRHQTLNLQWLGLCSARIPGHMLPARFIIGNLSSNWSSTDSSGLGSDSIGSSLRKSVDLMRSVLSVAKWRYISMPCLTCLTDMWDGIWKCVL